MSGGHFGANPTPAAWLAALRERLRQSRERRLVWVRGAVPFTRGWIEAATAGVDPTGLLRVGVAGPETLTADQGRHYLGREFEVLVWDARGGFSPDGFGALAGTLRGGGVLILITPEIEEWPGFDDPDYQRMGSPPSERMFLGRLARILSQADSVLAITEGAGLPSLPAPGRITPLTLPTQDQTQAIAAILRVRRGHRRRPLVITADRGRGKSAALGIAAAKLLRESPLEQPPLTILVTAPRPGALTSFWQHATLELPGVDQDSAGLRHRGGSIRYVPPAQLLEARPDADLLLVDEAAAIPVPILRALVERYARVVFASTVHGYEGSGRGFVLRFQEHLHRAAPGWQSLTLDQPVRWAQDDPLERLLNRLLLLDAEPAEQAIIPEGAETALIPWPRGERTRDEERLTEVFGLLVNAHYQTTPDDLRLLLDDESSECWLAIHQGAVVGAAWALAEGGLPAPLAEAVRRGLRRTRGHLLPQALAAYGGDAEAAMLRYRRLVRVAVHPQWRRRGLGQRLIEAAIEGARTAGADLFGTSFGASPELVGFWQRCGLHPLRLGLHSDAASGAPSMMMGLGLTATGDTLCQRHGSRFAEHWPLLLATELQTLAPALVWTLAHCWVPPVSWSVQDALEAEDFATGSRPLALTRLPLQRLTWSCTAAAIHLLGDDATLWCRAILQQTAEERWQAEGLARGRKDAYRRLRRAAERLLTWPRESKSGQ